jgi:adenylosuccinate lyase
LCDYTEFTFGSATIKFGGAIGNFNALNYAHHNVNWIEWSDKFIESLGFKRSKFTTQIDHYDMMCAFFDCMKSINTLFIDLSRDVWEYISRDYFVLNINEKEVGSSTMPHKVNPINFENAEGNFEMSNGMFEIFCRKLPISRLQRDLTDSTVTRNFGSAFGYMFLAMNSLYKGLGKLQTNPRAINDDLDSNYHVVCEGIQTVMKREGIHNGYEIMKEFTRKYSKPGKDEFEEFIAKMDVDDVIKSKLLCLSPKTYVGRIPSDYK